MTLKFCMPRVRGRGAGLGNELIPWARAFLAAQMLDAVPLPPAFGLNSRQYWRHFGTPRYDWLRQRVLELALPVIEFQEADYLEHGGGDFLSSFRSFAEARHLNERDRFVLVTEGMWGGYRHIAAARDFIASTLYGSRFAARNLVRLAERIDRSKILVGMHVRLGDFGQAPPELSAYRGAFNLALPLAWYRNIAIALQQALGDEVQFLVVSDGTPEQLRPLLDGLPAITTSDIPDSDCSDLLALARADLLVCSVSSFSTMAAFLSNAPYLWFEPNLQQHPEGVYSIWGHESAQRKPGSPTLGSIAAVAGYSSEFSHRGTPVGLNGCISDFLVQQVWAEKGLRQSQSNLIEYGVVKILSKD